MVKIKRVKRKSGLRIRGKAYGSERLVCAAISAAVFGLWFFVIPLLLPPDPETGDKKSLRNFFQKNRRGPDLHVASAISENYNANAYDIRETLKCDTLLNETFFQGQVDDFVPMDLTDDRFIGQNEEMQAAAGMERRRRRLQEDAYGNDGPAFVNTANAKFLFCLAAYADEDTSLTDNWKDHVTCDAVKTKKVALLDLWATARAEMQEGVLMETLTVATEQPRQMLGENLYVWAPALDNGMEYMITEINEVSKNVDYGGIHGLDGSLGRNRLFVDAGSSLGFTSMAVSILYPGTEIVSFEPASPNWLYQEINWLCHDQFEKVKRTALLAGVGPTNNEKDKTAGSQMAKFMWRPAATTSCRSWTPKNEHVDSDIELQVKLRPWHLLLKDAGVRAGRRIDVLNVDCEGCEYNMIPALTDKEFDDIQTVMGRIHWGYIPLHKKPSSKRGRLTHQRLCSHENFARNAKECCDFPDLAVKSSNQGEKLVREGPPGSIDKDATVKDVAGDLCNDFDVWAISNNLTSIENDFGWFEISSMAD